MANRGHLLGIATREERHAPMNEILAARVSKESGVGGDARGKPGRRQATVITRRSWESACSELGPAQLPWTSRRANLLIDGVELKGKIGYDLKIGDAVLTITGETRPCKVMNQAHPGLMAALRPEWRGGVTCRVTRAGNIEVGCEVVLSRNVVRQSARVAFHHARRFLKRSRSVLSGLSRKLGLKKGSQASPAEH
jgi:MOSC domain-containing protein YiiM